MPPTDKRSARERLAALYPDRTSVRRVLAEAGVPAARVDLNGSASDMWFNAVEEASHLGLLDAVLAVAAREYPTAPPAPAPTAPPPPAQPPQVAAPSSTWRIGAPSQGLDFRKLTGEQWKTLQEGLVAAFQTMDDLRAFAKHRLSQNLDVIVSVTNLNTAAFELIRWAESRGHTERLYRAARAERPDNTSLAALELYATPPVAGAGAAPVTESSLERILRKVDRPIELLELVRHLGEAAARVCQVRVRGATLGTGFLIGPSAVMTNHHVVEALLADPTLWDKVALHFDVHRGTDGQVVRLDSDFLIAASAPTDDERPGVVPVGTDDPRLDYAVLRVAGKPGAKSIEGANGTPKSAERGFFALPEGDVALTAKDGLYIAQHPNGRPMEIALEVEGGATPNAAGTRLAHKVNTEPGSSGSPVFTLHGQLVALHHAGVSSVLHTHNEAVPIDAIYRSLRQKGALGDIER